MKGVTTDQTTTATTIASRFVPGRPMGQSAR